MYKNKSKPKVELFKPQTFRLIHPDRTESIMNYNPKDWKEGYKDGYKQGQKDAIENHIKKVITDDELTGIDFVREEGYKDGCRKGYLLAIDDFERMIEERLEFMGSFWEIYNPIEILTYIKKKLQELKEDKIR